MRDQILQHRAVRRDPVRQWIAPQSHHSKVGSIRAREFRRRPLAELFEIQIFGLGKRIEQGDSRLRIALEYLVTDGDQVIDGVVATLIEGREPGLQRVWNQRLNVGIVRLNVDRRREFTRAEQLPDRLSRFDGHDVDGRFVALDMLVAG